MIHEPEDLPAAQIHTYDWLSRIGVNAWQHEHGTARESYPHHA